MSIEIEYSPIGPVTIDLFAPKNDIVGTPMMDEIWPRPLSVAKAYLHNEIKIILSLKLYLPHKEVMLTSLSVSYTHLTLPTKRIV